MSTFAYLPPSPYLVLCLTLCMLLGILHQEKVENLQELLKIYMLRRVKEDVQKNIGMDQLELFFEHSATRNLLDF